jgi:hypothetical protein|tara:strand:+ start:202 stop:393 length:192 start_codon:yes stop_codon:yes gene_type:complete
MRKLNYKEWILLNEDFIENVISEIILELDINKKNYKFVYNLDLLEDKITKYLYETSDNKYELY